jgi:site-specific recombinase XerC
MKSDAGSTWVVRVRIIDRVGFFEATSWLGEYAVASIYKRGRDDGNKLAPYWITYIDAGGKKKTRRGFTDKGLTEQLAKQLENEARKHRSGLVDPLEEELASQRRRPIKEQIEEFETHLATKSSTSKHVKLTMTRIRRLVDAAKITTIADINKARIEKALREIRKADDLGNRTFNHYVQAIDSFARWLVANQRLAANPLAGLVRLNNEVDVRHQRRALSADEVVRLLDSARTSKRRIQGYSGEQRARSYLFSYMTGLRRKEMASLTSGSFQLDAEPATVTVEAACSKHRRRDVLPLHPDLAAEVRGWIAELNQDDRLFPRLDRKKTWLMVKLDLERVGIPYETAEGVADFHAAGRHSHVTELFRSGASPTQVRELARHSDIRMTMRYTHVGLAEQAKALAGLTSPRARENGATGIPHEPSESAEWEVEQTQSALEAWQYIGSTLVVLERLFSSLDDTGMSPESKPKKRKKPGKTELFDANCHFDVTDDTSVSNWRRRESNPRPVEAW